MTLRLPSEVVVERVLPTLRVQLADALSERGLTQQEIATHLGVTQAAVSQYLDDPDVDGRIADHPRTRETVKRIADGFTTQEMDGYDALSAMLSLLRDFVDRGPICTLHEEAMPSLENVGCDLCVRGPDEGVTEERDVLADVRKAARVLSTTPGMAAYVPNVGTNVGAALRDATDAIDVAAIPGRIYARGDAVEVPANPEFGASRHVATVVLAAMTVDPTKRAALNVATDDALITAARDRGDDTLEFDSGYEDRESRLTERFETHGSVPTVVYHRGAFGIEPITYVIAESAEGAARYVRTLLEDMPV
ncbi:thiamine-phosphate synthase family protein [Halodesulfurarchaeum sp. HSR-GB]|uniref:thiamine-phosphate synthase family protein n=1 Tax=Halodesulfurarchaeum sp. HSR-GB TaxID=3074077 RepID=UPI002863F7C9|nr:thiamine-phosphate synthase family protein [Halodesulfurarchaeum sp. HSR-GB]MDR5657782.1 thiamine-phosphate synthase family protein [Halodesulfurarchaeum sp. HSR-GB]